MDKNKYREVLDEAMEENDRRFQRISSLLGENDFDSAYVELERIVNSSKDRPFILVKCAALLLTLDRPERSSEIASMALQAIPDDESGIFEMAVAMRGLGRHRDAMDILDSIPTDERTVLERARNLLASGDPAGCIELLQGMACRSSAALRCEALSKSDEHEEALAIARSLIGDEGVDYETGHLLLGVMLRAGDVKGAKRFAADAVKAGKDPDSLALKSFVMRINGRTPASMNYANQALLLDKRHIGALWNMALCLLEKGRRREAKVFAGAINEVSPADPLALEILELASR